MDTIIEYEMYEMVEDYLPTGSNFSTMYDINENLFSGYGSLTFHHFYKDYENNVYVYDYSNFMLENDINFFSVVKDKYNDDKINFSSFILSPLCFYTFGEIMALGQILDYKLLDMFSALIVSWPNFQFHYPINDPFINYNRITIFIKNNTDWFYLYKNNWWHFSPGIGVSYEYKRFSFQIGYNKTIDYVKSDWENNDYGVYFSIGWKTSDIGNYYIKRKSNPVSSIFSGGSISMDAGEDINVQGSYLGATNDVILSAEDVNITASKK